MSRRRRRIVIQLDQLLAASPTIRRQHDLWLADGYAMSSARIYRCKDGSFTARVVWRNRREIVSTVTCTVQGIVFA